MPRPIPSSDDPLLDITPPNVQTNVAPVLNANSLDDKHKLSPGDKISFQILEDRDPLKSLGVTHHAGRSEGNHGTEHDHDPGGRENGKRRHPVTG
jgi:hypothetical protein